MYFESQGQVLLKRNQDSKESWDDKHQSTINIDMLVQIVKLYDNEQSFKHSISFTLLQQSDAFLCRCMLFTFG